MLRRADQRLGHPDGPHEPGGAQARRHLVLPVPDGPARHRDPPAAADDRRIRVRRGVLHRRRAARRSVARPAARWVGRRDERADQRARPHRHGDHLAGAAAGELHRARRRAAAGPGRPPAARLADRPGTSYKALAQRQRDQGGAIATTGSSLLKLGISEMAFDVASLRADTAGAAAMLDGPDTSACWPRRPAASPAAPARSSATSSANACSGCPASPAALASGPRAEAAGSRYKSVTRLTPYDVPNSGDLAPGICRDRSSVGRSRSHVVSMRRQSPCPPRPARTGGPTPAQ